MPAQAYAAAPTSQQQLAPVPQAQSAPVASTSADADAYLRARQAANVWQSNRNIAAQ
jgi:hypothetical protein